jgi:hypothetical protein
MTFYQRDAIKYVTLRQTAQKMPDARKHNDGVLLVRLGVLTKQMAFYQRDAIEGE